MGRPQVTLENYEEVYRFYKDYRPTKLTAWILSGGLGLKFRPSVHFAPGAEERVDEIIKSGRPLVIASNHLLDTDPRIIAAAAARESVLRRLVGNTFIPSKSPIFYSPDPSVKQRFEKYAVDGLGAIPVYREKDFMNDEAALKMVRKTLRPFMDVSVGRLNQGMNMAIFPEGERNEADPEKVQPLFSGIGSMVCRVSKVEQPAVLPWAIWYTEEGMQKPIVWIEQPSDERFTKPREVSDWLHPQMQTALDRAIALAT